MEPINGKTYPLWGQFVERKEEWMGGTLEDFGDSMDQHMFGADAHAITTITDITLEPNGDSAMFCVEGEKFGCGFDVQFGGITAGEEGWLTFSGYGGHRWRIQKKG